MAEDQGLSIAIVGMAGRYPGARDLDEFWANLRDGKEAISFFSEDELRASGADESRFDDVRYVPAKGYLEDVELFDAGFFGLSARQAEILDPQQRLFLEVAVEALDSAGYDPRRFPGAIGVFGGVSLNTYLLFNLQPNADLIGVVGWQQVFTSNRTDHLTTRVAYALDLRGPAVTVQSACSTSLVAVHVACASLLQGECDVALAGGVSISVPRKSGYLYREGGILSPDGHCRAFDADARGTLAGEGAGIVVLKRLDEAKADGDTIHAVIKGSAINNDGSLKVGYTAPSVDGQAAVIRDAQAVAGIDPETVSYVEAHGTGTPLGDPIELAALTRAFRRGTQKKRFCAIGSVKTNIGHLDAAAGVTGLIKTVLALRHRELPPSLHFARPNPEIDFDDSPFFVNKDLRPWITDGMPRRAGVSSFGFGGTNCHLVLEEAPHVQRSGPSRQEQLILLSAQTASSLDVATRRLASALQERPEVDLPDAAFTLAVGRTRHGHRRIAVCDDAAQCAALLTKLDPTRVFTGEVGQRSATGVVFLFPGQGSQHTGMGRELYERERVFREAMDRCFAIIEGQLGEDPRAVLWERGREDQLRQTQWAQCALFAVEWSLAQLWADWGVKPGRLLGHSVGEYVAACLGGSLDVEDCLRLVALRGALMQRQPAGSMLALSLTEHDARAWLDKLDCEGLSLAAVNGPSSCVVSGQTDLIERLERGLSQPGGVQCRRLGVSHAFHSAMMEPLLDEFAEAVARVTLRVPSSAWISNLTGRPITNEEATDPRYWVRHLRGTVRFADGLSYALKERADPVLEVGPGQVLRGLARWHPDKNPGQAVLASLPPAGAGTSETLHVRTTLGRLWIEGIELDHSNYFRDEQRRRVTLPAYAFDRKRYWIDPPDASRSSSTSRTERRPFERWFYAPAWRRAPLITHAPDATDSTREKWLIIADRYGIADRVAHKIRARGGSVAVRRIDGAGGPGDHDGVGSSVSAFRELLDVLAANDGLPSRILHLAALSATERSGAPAFEAAFFGLLHLAQALSSRNIESVRLVVATRGVHDVTGSEQLSPANAATLGPCRVLPQEDPRIVCRNVDFDLAEGERAETLERVSEQLLAEALAPDGRRAVAYRGTQRWIEDYAEIESPAAASSEAPPVRPGGVYLVTGGLGGVGLEIAALFAQAEKVKIVLVGRSALPPRETWADIAARGDGDRDACRIRRVVELERAAEVVVIAADVTDRAQMIGTLTRVRERFGRLDGIVHAAGVSGGGVMQLKTDAAAAAVFAPKVRGVEVLRSVLNETGLENGLDFVMLCSARGSLFGGFGQVDYAAANAYLDVVAHAMARDGKARVIAVDWPGWKDIGMLADAVRADASVGPLESEATAVPHPLFDRVVRHGAQRIELFTTFTPSAHWVLDEHRIIGSPVLPGTSYVEMACAATELLLGGPGVELRSVFFLAPVVVRDGQRREVRATVEATGEGCVRFVFAVASRGPAGETVWRDVCSGEAAKIENGVQPTHDLRAWIARCSRQRIVETRETPIRDDNGPRWRSLREVNVGDRELVALFELPEEFAGDLGQYILHPALLDRVNLTAREYLAQAFVARNFYLPFAYGKVVVWSRLPRKLWAYSRLKTLDGDSGETITFDTIIVDEGGRELVKIADFGQKRVADVAGQLRALTRGEAVGPAVEVDARHGNGFYERALHDGISSGEGRNALKRILATHGLPQIVVSPMDLVEELDARTAVGVGERVMEAVARAAPAVTQERHPRPELATPYRRPGTELERSIANAWQDVLGVGPIGIDDNFFELGGDSVQGIQLVIALRKRHLELTQQQLFEHQTVASLAAVVQGASADIDSKLLPLAPAQYSLLAGEVPARAIAVRCRAVAIDSKALAAAIEALTDLHASLRLRVEALQDGRRQVRLSSKAVIPITAVNLPADGAEARISRLRAELARKLSPREGRVACMAHLIHADGSSELLIVVHEICADVASVGTLLEDLHAAYGEASTGKSPNLRRRAADLVEWLTAMGGRLEDSVARTAGEPLAKGRSATYPHLNQSRDAAGQPAMIGKEVVRLAAVATESLVLLAREQRVGMEEVLLTLVSACLAERFATGDFALELERSLRGESVGGLDLQRTVGPLSYVAPVNVRARTDAVVGGKLWRHIKAVVRPAIQDGRRAVLGPRQENVAGDPGIRPASDRARFRVAYLGDLDYKALGGRVVDVGWESTEGTENGWLALRAFRLDRELVMSWEFDALRYDAKTVRDCAARLLELLRSVTVAERGEQPVELVPSDFPLVNLDERSLERFKKLLHQIDDDEKSSEAATR